MSGNEDATVLTAAPDEKRMPFLEHLAELRDRLKNSVIAILIAAVACFIYRGALFRYLAKPILSAFRVAKAQGVAGQLIFTSPIEAFLVLLKTALVASIFVASPVIFYQLWAFIAPGLYPHEKKWALPFVFLAVLLFVGGGLFCYSFVLPPGYQFLLTAGTEASVELMKSIGNDVQIMDAVQIRPLISMEEYFGLTLMLLLVFGAVFEMPLILCVLSMLGIVSARSLWKFNRYAILIFAVAGAVLTPGDLVIGQLAMAGSLTVLYNLSIAIAWLVERKRTQASPDDTSAAIDDPQQRPPNAAT